MLENWLGQSIAAGLFRKSVISHISFVDVPDKESSKQASQRYTNQLAAQREQDLKAPAHIYVVEC
jgi:hypothetical protein